MDVVIIEDEKPAAENLMNLLGSLDKEIQVAAILETVKDAIQWFQDNKDPDLIFLDVHLADDICFKIFEVANPRSPIIFTTAYDQYALRAFKLSSIDYLLKPIDRDELQKGLGKLDQLKANQKIDIGDLLESFENPGINYQKRFMVTAGEKIKSIPVEDIAYFFGQDKYVYLITHQNDRYLIDHTLTHLEELLDPEDFFRINRQFLIGFEAISNMYAFSRGRVKVELTPASKDDTIVSIDRSGTFKKWLDR